MPFGLVMSPTLIGVLIAMVLQGLTLGWGFVQSNRADHYAAKLTTCKAEHAAFVKQTEAVAEIAKAKAKATEESNQRTADETAKGWASALAVVRADYAKRLRNATRASSGGSGLSQVANTGREPDGTSGDAIPPPERVAQDCAETTLKLNHLQWYLERLI